MTTELEKIFFDTFGIERKRNHEVTLEAISGGVKSANFSQKTFYEYPQISDKQYLELILIISETDELSICYDTVEHFKEGILECFIEYGEDCKHQVQAIFEVE